MRRGALVVTKHWPDELVLVRHGESMGNLADSAARQRHAERLDLELRDADVPLSETGRQQADAVGRFISDLRRDRLPELVVTSPYRRAAETAERALAAWQGHTDPVIDERLRERDLGAFDGLTWRGIEAEYAQEAH